MLLVARAQDVGDHLAGAAALGDPHPALVRLASHEAPQFVQLQYVTGLEGHHRRGDIGQAQGFFFSPPQHALVGHAEDPAHPARGAAFQVHGHRPVFGGLIGPLGLDRPAVSAPLASVLRVARTVATVGADVLRAALRAAQVCCNHAP